MPRRSLLLDSPMHGVCRAAVFLCLIVSTQSAWAIGPVPSDEEVVTPYSAAEIERILDKKFADGNYSRTGADQCLRCHDASGEHNAMGIFHNVHGSRKLPGGPFQGLQCEACHGPGGDHTKPRLRPGEQREPMISFGSQAPVPADKQNSVCLSCHQDKLDHAWLGSAHQQAEVPCASCHAVHQARDPMHSADSQITSCGGCHQTQHALSKLPSNHMLQSGQLQCSDCHAAHGSANQAALKHPTTNDNCYSCHAEKRGPLLWEHQPVTEDCSTCHNPHGSINTALLTKRPPQLCQSCHSALGHPSVPYGTNDPVAPSALFVSGSSCVNCHSQVHGSNHPSGKSLQR